MTGNWHSGNAAEDGLETRGWILGHFIDPSKGVRSSKDVEIKWFRHPAGDKRPEWTADDQRTTLVLLVAGKLQDRPHGSQRHSGKAGRLSDMGARNRPLMGSALRVCGRYRPLAFGGGITSHPPQRIGTLAPN